MEMPYYVFRRNEPNYYLGPTGYYTNDVKGARRFDTIHSLIVWVANNNSSLFPCGNDHYSIEKVELKVVTETVVTPLV